MHEQLSSLLTKASADLAEVRNRPDLEAAKARLVGPNGAFTALMKQMGSVPKEQRPALGKLINLKKKVAAVKGKLKLCCIHPDLLEVFRITRLDQVFEIYPEEQSALDKF